MKQYFFLRDTETSQYLQTSMDMRTGRSEFWLDKHRACTPCFDSEQQADRYRQTLQQIDPTFTLTISAEAL